MPPLREIVPVVIVGEMDEIGVGLGVVACWIVKSFMSRMKPGSVGHTPEKFPEEIQK